MAGLWRLTGCLLVMSILGAQCTAACEVCVSVLKGIGDLGVTNDNCTLLADLANFHFSSDTEGGTGIPGDYVFTCNPNFTPTTIYACADVDDSTAEQMYNKYDMDSTSIQLYYFLPYDIDIIDACRYSSDSPFNQKGAAFVAPCYSEEASVKRPPTTACERPPRSPRAKSPAAPSPPDVVHCSGEMGKNRKTLRLGKWAGEQ